MVLRARTRRLSGFIEPCLPRPADKPPAGPGWLHEIKHDGFRIVAVRDGAKVKLFSRRGTDFTDRFPAAAAAIGALKAKSFVVDGEAIACDDSGLAVFELIRYRRHDHLVQLCAFDLLMLDGEDLRRQPLEARKTALARLLRGAGAGVVLNEHYEAEGAVVYRQACALGCEGIVSKRKGSPYRSGLADTWVKVKNPKAPAVKREAEEDWAESNRRRQTARKRPAPVE